MKITTKQIPSDQHEAIAKRALHIAHKGKISVDFDAPAGLIGKKNRKCKPTITKDGKVVVKAFTGTWQAIPVQIIWDDKPVIVKWESKHIEWNS